MPKVLRIINRFNLGGPTYNAAYLTKYMAPEFDTLLVGGANDINEANSEYIVKNLGLHPFIIPEMRRTINPSYDIIAYNKIKNIIKRYKPDIVHTHASKAGALGRRAAFNMNVPIIVHTFHGHVFDAYFNDFQSSLYQNVERKLAKKSTKIIALSENQKYDLCQKYKICPEDKTEIIPLGFDLDRFQENIEEKRNSFRSQLKIQEDEIAVGIIGRIVPIKNHTLFIESAKQVLEQTSKKVKFIIIGDGEDRMKAEYTLKSNSLAFTDLEKNTGNESFIFTSWMKDVDVAMAGLDIIALTSLNEGTPVSLIEAQAANKPIVSTNVGGIANVVKENTTALLCNSNEPVEFASKLLVLTENKELRNKMSNDGWQFVYQKFHYQRLVSDMSAFYHKLLGNI